MNKLLSHLLIKLALMIYNPPIEAAPEILIFTHRTPETETEKIEAIIRAYNAFWYQLDANHCLQIEFSEKPIYYGEE